ncbi:unnamed protein product [Polarella glacialis]|uniref:Uncharacterized protein n=1 Tax=Polarella glacialis TaxID=89957 RepID=A0A813LH81_POLGL|nr:unnamed protein product [Polarella glacialis]
MNTDLHDACHSCDSPVSFPKLVPTPVMVLQSIDALSNDEGVEAAASEPKAIAKKKPKTKAAPKPGASPTPKESPTPQASPKAVLKRPAASEPKARASKKPATNGGNDDDCEAEEVEEFVEMKSLIESV